MPSNSISQSDYTPISQSTRTNRFFKVALVYIVLLILIVAGYALLVTGINLVLGGSAFSSSPYLLGLTIFLTALAFLPLRNSLQQMVDRAFSQRSFSHQEQQNTFGRELSRATDINITLRILRQAIHDNLVPLTLHIYTYDSSTNAYTASLDYSLAPARPTSDLRFFTASVLVQVLSSQQKPLILGNSNTLRAALAAEMSRIAMLGAQLFVPLPGRQHLLGWVALGPRHSGKRYVDRDLEFLTYLCDQAALALERSQIVADLERRVQTMSVLTRVSQGINITLSFDDTLELIYTQTNNVLPTRDFHISLYDRNGDTLYPVFYLSNDERLVDRENRPLPMDQGLVREVLTSRHGLVTDDYERECRSHGKLPEETGLFSWVGVPLHAGAETIGVLSLASREAIVYYTEEQVNLLQAIADQAAGAITKVRLLQEAERRTRQLTSLNEVARSITSTLALEPLLNQILRSAVEILNCEAGSLLLITPETGEMTFEAAVGPVAGEIQGRHMAPGIGLVGRAVEFRQPIIQNDVHHSQDWHENIEQRTGFYTRDVLVVPMLVKDECLGAIEVINRKDGLTFSQDDQELLMAFASQAAVAMENARLYTQTDQTLANRVDELSVMQRIDRELNASLDVSRTMRITLEWSMIQSKADAGTVAIVNQDNIRIMAHQGYSSELDAWPEQLLPGEVLSIQHAVETGQPQFLQLAEPASPASDLPKTFLNGGCTQAVIPILREDQVIGIIILENKKSLTYPPETLAFLSRLCDHAAIAISNAQLYAAVQAANIAKSDFVSFVSHELKTPMTSIRGFTDLLATGIAGQVNDTQSNFLNTIRSNVDRMATLVSDLADVSRIEANRLRLDFQAVELSEVVEDVTRSTHTQIEAKNQILIRDISSDLPSLWADRTRLSQVLTNLLTNAHKYTPSGGIIRIIAELVSNQWDPLGAKRVAHITIQDNGFGISPENQKKIFQKFFRSDDQRVRDIPGTGLGLNITKTLVEMQGGKIWFESIPDQGTKFHFTIPIIDSA